MKGYIYILTNPAFPSYLKIGKTTRNTRDRAKELSSSTGVPQEFEIAYEINCTNCDEAERIAHNQLTNYRVSTSREFFNISLKDAIHIVNIIVKGQLTQEIQTLNNSLETKVELYRQNLNKEITEKISILQQLSNNPHKKLANSDADIDSKQLNEFEKMLIKAVKWGKVRILKKMLDKNIQMPIIDKSGKPVKEIAKSFGNLNLYNKYLRDYKAKNQI